jgi:hypothetical protein
MLKFAFGFFCSLVMILFGENTTEKAVTYTFSGGRFGDDLISYLHAKWFSYKYKIPLLYHPFPHSSNLILDDKERHYDFPQGMLYRIMYRTLLLDSRDSTLYIIPHFPDSKYELDQEKPQDLDLFSDHWKDKDFRSIYVIPYFPEEKYELEHPKVQSPPLFSVDWKDNEFRSLVRGLIAPKKSLALVSPPTDSISIALHLRDGGEFDSPRIIKQYFWKLPPLDFYIASLIKILELFPEKKIYCHLFTDASDPSFILEKIQKELPKDANIVFNYRKTGNRHDANILEDFFSLFLFDVLIRSGSNFGIVPSLLNDYAVVVSPGHFSKNSKDSIVVDKLQVFINQRLYQRLLKNPAFDSK